MATEQPPYTPMATSLSTVSPGARPSTRKVTKKSQVVISTYEDLPQDFSNRHSMKGAVFSSEPPPHALSKEAARYRSSYKSMSCALHPL